MSNNNSLNHDHSFEDQLGELDELLEAHGYPATTHELVEAYGDHRVQSQGGSKSVATVLAPIDDETYESAEEVQERLLGLLNRR